MIRVALNALFALALLGGAPLSSQTPAPAKGPDKEVAEKIVLLKECVMDKKMARDAEGVAAIDVLVQKLQAGVEDKDRLAIAKALDGALTQGKLRPHDNISLYSAAAVALGYCGLDGAKVLKAAYENKRYPKRKEWAPLREFFLRSLGKTKEESMAKFLTEEAVNNTEAALMAAAGEALGNYEEAKEAVRKEIVSDLIKKWGEEEELASQLGSGNMQALNAKDRLSAFLDKWNATLAKLTRQNFKKHLEWQNWHNKNRNASWQ
ncbi:MAG: hypothetical protein IT456_01275 [Planctomycetes bacterium]|jgi:hypothetical protein|nr:hypothetical protein [Planctomycetota bacterium]